MAAVRTLVAVDDLEPAHWLIAQISTFAYDVGSLLPADFGAYGRVFHPAYNDAGLVRWAEIARINGKVVHPAMQFTRLLGYASRYEDGYREVQSDVFDTAPDVGTLPTNTATVLIRTLARHTSAVDRCWFAVWDGWAGMDSAPEFRNHPSFQLPGRAYHLARGSITAVTQSAETTRSARVPLSLWWPDDHAWCVATDIDLDSTYIGASEACVEELLTNPELEAAAVSVSTGITADSDPLNPVELE